MTKAKALDGSDSNSARVDILQASVWSVWRDPMLDAYLSARAIVADSVAEVDLCDGVGHSWTWMRWMDRCRDCGVWRMSTSDPAWWPK